MYLPPTRPNFVLENMRRAYEARDSVQTSIVYHVNYQGKSSTAVDPENTLFEFTKPQEVSHVWALWTDTNVSHVVFNMGQFDSWTREQSLDPTTHPEWASITISRGIKLEVTVGLTTYTVGNDDFFVYQFAPITSPSSPDTLWQIIRWQEIKGQGGS